MAECYLGVPGVLLINTEMSLEEALATARSSAPSLLSAAEVKADLVRIAKRIELTDQSNISRRKVALAAAVTIAVTGTIAAGLWRTSNLAKARSSPRVTSIAVLPLENLSRDPQQEYLADGLTDELITNLSKVSSLRVIARNSAMRYKARPRSIRDIGKELSVDAILDGTVSDSLTACESRHS